MVGRMRVLDEHSNWVDAATSDTSVAGCASQPDALFEALLTTLANFDVEYERELERVRVGSSSEEVKNRVVHRLQERHRVRREPYVQQLARIHDRAAAVPKTLPYPA
jgi:hypothetical protein